MTPATPSLSSLEKGLEAKRAAFIDLGQSFKAVASTQQGDQPRRKRALLALAALRIATLADCLKKSSVERGVFPTLVAHLILEPLDFVLET